MYQNTIKPIFDKIFALILLLAFFPIFFIFFIFSIFSLQLFTQKRTGKNKKVFTIYKFKTMNDTKDENGKLLPDKTRLTTFGAFLRRFSLDELPQLWNVLKGDMSFVGPRPLLTDYMEKYNEFQDQRHLVKPGITGWVQVNGRNSLTWEKRFELDVFYVQNQSFLLDLKILVLTCIRIFQKKGSFTEENIPLEPFDID